MTTISDGFGNGDHIGYFGYGSLVNAETLRTDVVAIYPARLTGWRRVWRQRPVNRPKYRGIGPAVLTAERAEDGAIDGVMIIDKIGNIGAVDAREDIYQRVTIPRSSLHFYADEPNGGISLHVYQRDFEPDTQASPSPILRSYLDAVLQGYHKVFGEAGVRRFIAETSGFGLPIFEDRQEPVYPRPIVLAAGERELFDALLAGLNN